MNRTPKEQMERLKAAFPGHTIALGASIYDGGAASAFSGYIAQITSMKLCEMSNTSLDHAVEQLLATISTPPEDGSEIIAQMEVAQ